MKTEFRALALWGVSALIALQVVSGFLNVPEWAYGNPASENGRLATLLLGAVWIALSAVMGWREVGWFSRFVVFLFGGFAALSGLLAVLSRAEILGGMGGVADQLLLIILFVISAPFYGSTPIWPGSEPLERTAVVLLVFGATCWIAYGTGVYCRRLAARPT